MKLKMIIYWTATALIALETFAGGIVDLIHGRTGVFSGPHVTDVLISLGYPVYVLAILGVWKIPGAITLVVPGLLRLKEWAYAGIVFELSAGAVSHAICGHRQEILAPVVLAGVALTSWALRPPSRVFGSPHESGKCGFSPDQSVSCSVSLNDELRSEQNWPNRTRVAGREPGTTYVNDGIERSRRKSEASRS